MERLEVSTEVINGIQVAELKGELDISNADELNEVLVGEIRKLKKGEHFIVVLDGLSFMDSTGIGVLLTIMKELNEIGGKLLAVCTNKGIKKIIDIAGLTLIMPVYASVEEAVRAQMAEVKQ